MNLLGIFVKTNRYMQQICFCLLINVFVQQIRFVSSFIEMHSLRVPRCLSMGLFYCSCQIQTKMDTATSRITFTLGLRLCFLSLLQFSWCFSQLPRSIFFFVIIPIFIILVLLSYSTASFHFCEVYFFWIFFWPFFQQFFFLSFFSKHHFLIKYFTITSLPDCLLSFFHNYSFIVSIRYFLFVCQF